MLIERRRFSMATKVFGENPRREGLDADADGRFSVILSLISRRSGAGADTRTRLAVAVGGNFPLSGKEVHRQLSPRTK